MKKDKWKKEIDWLSKDKYGGKVDEVKMEKDINRLEQGEPIDYIIGWKDFLGCRIDLSERPLIPREETEYWVGGAIKEIFQDSSLGASPDSVKATTGRQGKTLEILDIFAGSGCIGLAVLKYCPGIKMTFADKEEKCIKQIKKNLKLNKLTAKVKLSNLFSTINKKFDIIFANPPYIPLKGQRVARSVQDWEPSTALYGGDSGLVVIEEFLKQAQSYLKPRGKIYLEFGFGQKMAMEKILRKFEYKNWQFHKDQFGKFRWVVVE